MQTFAQINIVMTDLNAITSVLAQSLPEMMEELSVIIEELSGMIGEMPDMIRELDVLMETSGEGISTAIEKVSAIDIEALNEAIRDLQAIVEPLAKLFGRR